MPRRRSRHHGNGPASNRPRQPARPPKPKLIPIEQDENAIMADAIPKLPTILFYCRKCRAVITPMQLHKRFEYRCPTCGLDAAFGTEKSVRGFYNYKG